MSATLTVGDTASNWDLLVDIVDATSTTTQYIDDLIVINSTGASFFSGQAMRRKIVRDMADDLRRSWQTFVDAETARAAPWFRQGEERGAKTIPRARTSCRQPIRRCRTFVDRVHARRWKRRRFLQSLAASVG